MDNVVDIVVDIPLTLTEDTHKMPFILNATLGLHLRKFSSSVAKDIYSKTAWL